MGSGALGGIPEEACGPTTHHCDGKAEAVSGRAGSRAEFTPPPPAAINVMGVRQCG